MGSDRQTDMTKLFAILRMLLITDKTRNGHDPENNRFGSSKTTYVGYSREVEKRNSVG
jgi:hypothetical protein